jgi:hypothetical protein
MIISGYHIKFNAIISLTRQTWSSGMAINLVLHNNGFPTSTCRTSLHPKGYNGSTARGYQLVGKPFLFGIIPSFKGLKMILTDRNKALKRQLLIEFGSDEFLDIFQAVLRVIKEEREAMEKRHNNLIDFFTKDIEMYKVDDK